MGAQNPATRQLVRLLSDRAFTLGSADLVIYEVMRGFRPGKLMREASRC